MNPKVFPTRRRDQNEERKASLRSPGEQQPPGFCYYEWRKGYERIELDYAVWVEGLGRFALQVKGGTTC